MTPKEPRAAQIELLKRALARRHSELLEETREDVARAREETYGDIAGAVTDVGDQASAGMLADLGQTEISRDVREVGEIEAALARIEAGTYGRCAECGIEIDLRRLRAWPVAARCTGCQASHEHALTRAQGK